MKYLLLILLLSSCSASWHLRQAKKHIQKAEALGATVKTDTIFQEVKLIVPEVHTDTIFHSEEGDTVFIEKDRLKIKYVHLKGDTVKIQGECEADTVIKTVVKTINQEIKAPRSKWSWLPWILFALCLIIILIRR